MLETLSDIVNRNINNDFAALTGTDYEQLDAVLKELIYVVGDDEKHPLAPLMDFIGDLIIKYEDKHLPKLTELFPELTENTTPNDAKSEVQKGNSITDVSEKPTNNLAAEAFFSIGSLFLKGEKKKKAISAYDQAIQLDPEYAYAHYNRGRAKGSLGQYESEIVDLDETVRLIPDFAEAYLLRGIAKTALNHYESAVIDFDETLRLNLDNSLVYIVYVSRGMAKVALGYHEAAIADFDESIRLDLDHSVIYTVYFLRGYSKWVLVPCQLYIDSEF